MRVTRNLRENDQTSSAHDTVRSPETPVHAGRRHVERILQRAAHLPEPDRVILQAIYELRVPAREVARLHGTSARAVRRRVRALVRRVLSPAFAFVAQRAPEWPETLRLVATMCVLHARSIRDTARLLDMSYHSVRRLRQAVHALELTEHNPEFVA